NGNVIDCGERPLIENIDNIPFPDFSDFPKDNYIEDYIRLQFNRGCVGTCVYCVENDTMGYFRSRSSHRIIEEIKLRIEQGYNKLQITDLALSSDMHNLIEVSRLIIKDDLNVEFVFSEFRHSTFLTKEVFNLLRRAGFRIICFGTESGSQTILDRMQKLVKARTIEDNFRDAHAEGLKVIIYLMVGFPGETEETFLETILDIPITVSFRNGNPSILKEFNKDYDSL
ncbi:MAG: radical SAM protein, partial [Candidatus Omnitrophica bacterium]|nr:radical SAM protein [Candidatus Omnitrophota bacterium]